MKALVAVGVFTTLSSAQANCRQPEIEWGPCINGQQEGAIVRSEGPAWSAAAPGVPATKVNNTMAPANGIAAPGMMNNTMAPANGIAAPGIKVNNTMAPANGIAAPGWSGSDKPPYNATSLAGTGASFFAPPGTAGNVTTMHNMTNPVSPDGAVHSEGFSARKGTVQQGAEVVWCDVPLVKQCESASAPANYNGVAAPLWQANTMAPANGAAAPGMMNHTMAPANGIAAPGWQANNTVTRPSGAAAPGWQANNTMAPGASSSPVKAAGAPFGFARPPVTGVLTGLSDVHGSGDAANKPTLGGGSATGNVFGGFAETERKNLAVHGVLDGDKATGKQDLAGSAPALIRGRFGSLLVRPDGTWTYKADEKNPLVKAFGKRSGLLKDIFGLNVKDGGTGSEKPIVVVVNVWETLNGATA